MARPQQLTDAQLDLSIALSLLAREHLLKIQAIKGVGVAAAIQITVESAFIAGIGMYRSACMELGCEPNLDQVSEIFASLLVSPVRIFDEAGAEIPRH